MGALSRSVRRRHRARTSELRRGLDRAVADDRFVRCVEGLRAMPHGPGLGGLVVLHPVEPARATWIPTENLIDVLADLDRGAKWSEPLRTWPADSSPVVVVQADASALLLAMLDDGGIATMSAGGEA